MSITLTEGYYIAEFGGYVKSNAKGITLYYEIQRDDVQLPCSHRRMMSVSTDFESNLHAMTTRFRVGPSGSVIDVKCVNDVAASMFDVKNRIFDKVQSTFSNAGKKIITKESHDCLTKEIVKKVSTVIENSNLRNQMRINNIKKARNLLSFEKNNKILRGIYEESIN